MAPAKRTTDDSERNASTTKRFRAVMHGRVQGVGFRYSTLDKAHSLGLCGWVTNRWDRTVEVEAEGSEGPLESFLSWLRVGPTMAHVSRVDVNWLTPIGEPGAFEVR